MADGLSRGYIRLILLGFNFVFVLIGLVTVIAGFFALRFLSAVASLGIMPEATTPAIGLMSAGSLLFFMTFCGCCGALTEYRWILLTFSVVLSVMVCGEFTVGLLAFLFRTRSAEITAEKLNSTMSAYFGTDKRLRASWDLLQDSLKCCGVKSYEDWLALSESNGKIPESCGEYFEADRRPGCLEEIAVSFKQNQAYVGVVAFLLSFVELVGITFACFLADKSRRREGERSVGIER